MLLGLNYTVRSQTLNMGEFNVKARTGMFFPTIYNTQRLGLAIEKSVSKNKTVDLSFEKHGSLGPSTEGIFEIAQIVTTGFYTSAEYKCFLNRDKVFQPLCLLIWPLVFQLKSKKNAYTGLYYSFFVAYHQTKILFKNNDAINNYNPQFLIRLGFKTISNKVIVLDQALGIGVQYHNHINYSSYYRNNFMFNTHSDSQTTKKFIHN